MSIRSVLIVQSDPLSSRVFELSGINARLHQKFGRGGLSFIRFPNTPFFDGREQASDVAEHTYDSLVENNAEGRVAFLRRRADEYLDVRFGFFPLALRFNYRHRFHLDRMKPAHRNGFLDSDRFGVLPDWGICYRIMFWWLFHPRRYVPPKILELLGKKVRAIVVTNLQSKHAVPFLVAARRYRLPVVGYVASWDHPVGKGVMFPFGRRYVVQNEDMKTQLVKYHGLEESRIVVTGWPQMDIYKTQGNADKYRKLLEEYGLAHDRPCILIAGNTETNRPTEPVFVKRLVDWIRDRSAGAKMNVIFRPHPKDVRFQERFAAIADMENVYIQRPSYVDLETLATLLSHVNCVVTNAGTMLLDSIVNDRPTVCVVYDEVSQGEDNEAILNVQGEHYEALLRSEAFILAESFDEVTSGISRCLSAPSERREARKMIVQRLVGKLDGMAAERVAQSIVECVAGC